MNERIQELVGQAKFMAEETINKQISKNAELDAFAEKFAELIVADCIKIVEGYCETSPEIYGLPLDILEHFDMELKDENT